MINISWYTYISSHILLQIILVEKYFEMSRQKCYTPDDLGNVISIISGNHDHIVLIFSHDLKLYQTHNMVSKHLMGCLYYLRKGQKTDLLL